MAQATRATAHARPALVDCHRFAPGLYAKRTNVFAFSIFSRGMFSKPLPISGVISKTSSTT
jgi:hypothetical protein